MNCFFLSGDEVLSSNIVELRNVGFGYPGGPLLFSGAEFNIDARSRLVLLGENGNGKTTLVKLLVGELQPSHGEVKIDPACRVAVVNQHHADQIDLDLTPLAFLKRAFPGDGSYGHDQKLRSHLASCGVGSDKMLVKGACHLVAHEHLACFNQFTFVEVHEVEKE
jgi:ATP-binding cassette subfamily F protein 3